VAVILVVIACLLGLHHAFVKQNVVLAGLIVPALIMVFYILWVLHTAKKANCKHAALEVSYTCTRGFLWDGNFWFYSVTLLFAVPYEDLNLHFAKLGRLTSSIMVSDFSNMKGIH
jgi:hypothetical protein